MNSEGQVLKRAPGTPCGSAFGRFVGFKLGVVGLQGEGKLMKSQKNEILKLKELPNERLEGSWGALWLGIRKLFGFKLGVVGLQVRNLNPKIERATE